MREWIELKLKVIFMDSFRYIMPRCPRWFICRIASFSSGLTYRIAKEKVHIMRRELKKVFGHDMSEEKTQAIIKQGIHNLRKDLFETWMFPLISRDKIRNMTNFIGKDNLDVALKEGKGAIILLAHFGFRKLILPALGYEGYKVNQIAAKPISWQIKGEHGAAHRKIMDVEFKCEKSLPVNFIYTDESLKLIFKALSNNEIIVTTVDGFVGQKRIGVRFLNCTANFSPTAIHLALKTGASILPAFVVRQKDNLHNIIIERPLSLNTKKGKEDVIQEAVNEYKSILEKYVLEYPCHYVDCLYRAQLWPIDENMFLFQ